MIWAGCDLHRPIVLWDPQAAAMPGPPEELPISWYTRSKVSTERRPPRETAPDPIEVEADT